MKHVFKIFPIFGSINERMIKTRLGIALVFLCLRVNEVIYYELLLYIVTKKDKILMYITVKSFFFLHLIW